MNSKQIGAIAAVAIIAVAAIAGVLILNNNQNEDEFKAAYLEKGYYTFHVAFDKGFYDDLGFKVKPVIVGGSGQDAINAVLAGDATVAATGDAPYVNTLASNGPDKFVGLCMYDETTKASAGHKWVTTSKCPVKLTPIEGKSATDAENDAAAEAIKAYDGTLTVGLVSGSTTLTTFMKWCMHYGIGYSEESGTKEKIQIKKFPTGGEAITALGKGAIDMLGGSNPIPTNAVDKVSGAFIWGDCKVLGEPTALVLCTTKAKYDANVERMEKFVEATYKANKWISENIDEAVKICQTKSSVKDAATIKDALLNSPIEVCWKNINGALFDAWALTAKLNGFENITSETFKNSCPIADKINAYEKIRDEIPETKL